MTLMSWASGVFSVARDQLEAQVKRFKNREFMEAVVAGCALVAAADGTIKPEEKQKMVGFIKMSDELKVFDLEEVTKAFNKAIEFFEFDPTIGKAEALKLTAKLSGNSDAARTMVLVCCAIGASDGNFDPDEKKVVGEICKSCGLNPGDFGL